MTPHAWLAQLTDSLRTVLARLHADERGDIPERTLGTALMVAATITVVGIIVAKVTGWANAIGGP
jgi:hypothetical protein